MTAIALQPCGTNAAHRRHRKRGEDPCDACREAHRRYSLARSRILRANYPIRDCAACGQHRPIQRNGWCESCVVRWQQAGRPDSGPPPLDLEAVRAARAAGAATSRSYAQINAAIRAGGWDWTLERTSA